MNHRGNQKHRCTLNSLEHTAYKKNINVRLVEQRIHTLGWSLDDALNTPKIAPKGIFKYFYKNRPALEVAIENGINENTFRSRIYRGMTILDAVTKPVRPKVRYFKGEPAIEIAKRNGIKACTYQNRIRLGWSVEDAITTPVI